MQVSGLTEIISLICTSVISSQYPVLFTSWVSSSLIIRSGFSPVPARWQIFFTSCIPSGHTISLSTVATVADDCAFLCLLIQQKMFHFSSVKQEVVRLNFSNRSEYSKANWRINRVNLKLEDVKRMECIWQLGEYILVYQIKSGKRNPGTKLFSLLSMKADYRKSEWDQSQANWSLEEIFNSQKHWQGS